MGQATACDGGLLESSHGSVAGGHRVDQSCWMSGLSVWLLVLVLVVSCLPLQLTTSVHVPCLTREFGAEDGTLASCGQKLPMTLPAPVTGRCKNMVSGGL